jgi:hypothetical protein
LKVACDEHEIRIKSIKVRCYRLKGRKISVYVRKYSDPHRSITLAEVMILHKLKRLSQTRSLQIVDEHGISIPGQGSFQIVNPFRSRSQSLQMGCRIFRPQSVIRDDSEAFPKRIGELRVVLVHGKRST